MTPAASACSQGAAPTRSLHDADLPSHQRRPGVRHLSLVVAASLLVALGGCASVGPAPSTDPDVPVPDRWSDPSTKPSGPATPQAAEPAPRTPWWQQFDDPLMGEFIDAALSANPDLLKARAVWAQARALRVQAGAAQSPQLGTGASVTRTRQQQIDSTAWRTGLDASWEPDVFGALAATSRGRDADELASRADLANVQMALAAEVGQAYVQWRGTRQALRIARDNLAAQRETEDLVGWRVRAGLASSLDAEQARVSVQQLAASVETQQASLAQTAHQLAILLGRPPAALDERLGDGDRIPQTVGEWPVDVPADVLRRRPDVRAAEARLRAEGERLTAQQARRLPSFSVTGSLALQAATLGGLNGAGALARAVAAAVDWPLWDGGSRQGQINAQAAVQEQVRQAYRSALLTALQDVEDALALLGATQRQTAALEQADEAARNALLLARHRYQAGLIDFSTLLETQRSALSAQSSLSAARTNVALYRIRLYKALGGGVTGTPA